jgi:uncharacterized C2H2 Zn-finger protein
MMKFWSRFHPREVQESWLPCQQCSLYFPNKDWLNRHSNGKHSKSAEFVCKYCPLQYVTLSSYIEHSNLAHKMEIANSWNPCSNCNQHIPPGLDHKENECNKPSQIVQCQFCSQSFDFTSTYYFHANSVHVVLIKRIWQQCKICGKYFATDKDLMTHLEKSHPNAEKCHICNKTWENKATMIQHFNTDHSDMIPSHWKSCSRCRIWSLPDDSGMDDHLKKCQAKETETTR